MRRAVAAVALGAAACDGHAQMTWPPSRHGGTKKDGGFCPGGCSNWYSQITHIPGEPTINEPRFRSINVNVNSEGPSDWSRKNPWRAPGTAPVRGTGCGVAGGGTIPYDGTGPNVPQGAVQGQDGQTLPRTEPTVWKAGTVQEVAMGINANHAGGYSWRLCRDSSADSRGAPPLRAGAQPAEVLTSWGKHHHAKLTGVLPAGTMNHLSVVTSWDGLDALTAHYITLLGASSAVPGWGGLAGGVESNGTYVTEGTPQKLSGHCNATWVQLNNMTKVEIIAGEPSQPSWWRDVYLEKGEEIHHMGYQLPAGASIWSVVAAFRAAGLGLPVQWGRWGDINKPGSGCYVYMDSQVSLGVTTEILGGSNGECDSLPAAGTLPTAGSLPTCAADATCKKQGCTKCSAAPAWSCDECCDGCWKVTQGDGLNLTGFTCGCPPPEPVPPLPLNPDVDEECFQRNVLRFATQSSWIEWSNGTRTEFPLTKVTEGTFPAGSEWARNPIPDCYMCDQYKMCGDAPPMNPSGMAEGLPQHDEALVKYAWCSGYCSGENQTGADGKSACPPGTEQFPALAGLTGYGYSGTTERNNIPWDWNIVDKVHVPKDLQPGHYLLSWRWDCEQSAQVWQNCADIRIEV